jgi:hypothetical protein
MTSLSTYKIDLVFVSESTEVLKLNPAELPLRIDFFNKDIFETESWTNVLSKNVQWWNLDSSIVQNPTKV